MRNRAPILAAALAALGAGGCSSDGNNDWRAMFDAVTQSYETRNAAVSLDEAAAVPYATLGLRTGEGREQILLLATDVNGQRLWTVGTQVAITTRGGRIVATSGLEYDLTNLSGEAATAAEWARQRQTHFIADFAKQNLYNIRIDCSDTPLGTEVITILGADFTTLRVEEKCRSEQLGWDFTNTFWIDPDSGRSWRSIQQTHPKADPLEIEILRPPATAG